LIAIDLIGEERSPARKGNVNPRTLYKNGKECGTLDG
jgi:hypothetical protein